MIAPSSSATAPGLWTPGVTGNASGLSFSQITTGTQVNRGRWSLLGGDTSLNPSATGPPAVNRSAWAAPGGLLDRIRRLIWR